MPKVTAPLLSFDARGQIGHTQVYASWKGIPYARRYVVPNDARTSNQLDTRAVFKFLNAVYKFGPSDMIAGYDAYASGKPLLGRNAFTKQNMPALGTNPTPANINDLHFQIGARGGLPPSSVTPTPSTTSVSIAATVPTLPPGWTITKAVAIVMQSVDPTTIFNGVIKSGTASSGPWTVSVTGLTTATAYHYGYFLEMTRPDGLTAYSVDIIGQFTTS